MAENKPGFFQRLTKLFSKAEVPEPEFQAEGITTETSRPYYLEWLESFGIDPSRAAAYKDYLLMDRESPIVSAALDTIADAATCSSEGEAESVYTVSFPEDERCNEQVSSIFDDLEKRTTVKSETWEVIRGVSCLGDEFSEVIIDPRAMEISGLKALPAESMIAVPSDMPEFREMAYSYRQHNESGSVVAEFEPWQIVHYAHRVRRTDDYGRSHLSSTRRVYRQLQFIEDSMVINRLIRATMRYVHQVPVGGLNPVEARKYLDTYKRDFIRQRRFDSTGRLQMGRNPLDEERDFFVPIGKDVQGNVTAIQGQSSLDRISDVEFFLKKLFAALRVPPAYLGFESDTHAKSVITTLDVAFGRVVRRVQMTHGAGNRQVYQTELVLKGINPKTVNFNFVYNPIGTVDEMRRWQIELLKAQVAIALKTQSGLIQDDEYILKKILEIEEEDYAKILAANKKAKEEQERKNKEMMAQRGGFGDFGGKSGGDGFPTDEKEKAAKSFAGKPNQKVASAVESLLQLRSVRSDLHEIYRMSQPLIVEANGRTMPRSVKVFQATRS